MNQNADRQGSLKSSRADFKKSSIVGLLLPFFYAVPSVAIDAPIAVFVYNYALSPNVQAAKNYVAALVGTQPVTQPVLRLTLAQAWDNVPVGKSMAAGGALGALLTAGGLLYCRRKESGNSVPPSPQNP